MHKNIRNFKLGDLKKVSSIYKQSFPKNERFPFIILLFNIIRKNSNLYVMEVNTKIVGFIHLIFYKNMVFILYLAIDKNERNNKYGSYLLKWCLNTYYDKNIYVNIEEVNEKFDDYKLRYKRLNFYLNNNFDLSDYLSVEKTGDFNVLSANILSNNKTFNVDEYIVLDRKISIWYFNSKSKIEKIN